MAPTEVVSETWSATVSPSVGADAPCSVLSSVRSTVNVVSEVDPSEALGPDRQGVCEVLVS